MYEEQRRPEHLWTEQLWEAACLAHAVPGVTMRLHCASGAELLVSYGCLGADLDPCALRMALLCSNRPLAPRVAEVEFVAGLMPIGGGLYQRAVDSDERWFVTTLAPTAIVDLLAEPVDGDPERDSVHTIVKPDSELGVHAVCVRARDGTPAAELDEAALWALGRVAVAELLSRVGHPATAPSPSHPHHRTHHKDHP